MFGFLNQRCKQIQKSSADFGGLSIIAFTDFGQLPPVMDRPLWSRPVTGCGLGAEGAALYRKFDAVVTLVQQVRQGDPAAFEFRKLLLRLRNGILTEADIRFLNTRTLDALGPKALDEFQHGVRIFSTNAECLNYNK